MTEKKRKSWKEMVNWKPRKENFPTGSEIAYKVTYWEVMRCDMRRGLWI